LAISKQINFRLPDKIREKLNDLMEIDGLTATQVIINLIITEHKARSFEIRKYKAKLQNESRKVE